MSSVAARLRHNLHRSFSALFLNHNRRPVLQFQMISVTVAAHGKGKRCVGSHLRVGCVFITHLSEALIYFFQAYGSGRLSICDLDRKTLDKKATCVQPQLVIEALDLLRTLLKAFFGTCR